MLLVGALAMAIVGCDKPQPRPETDKTRQNTTAGMGMNDGMITAAVESVLLADADLRRLGFKVITRKGKVQLSGFVDNIVQMDRMITVTRGVPGVKGIKIVIGEKRKTVLVGNERDDGAATAKVKVLLLAENVNARHSAPDTLLRSDEAHLDSSVDNRRQVGDFADSARDIEVARIDNSELGSEAQAVNINANSLSP
jgi:hyperosmotically inducible protein